MSSPFLIPGPAMVSFSGGRTSALMLRLILNEGLQPDVHVLFANTGKEREETLEFVRDCGAHWGVPITWIEWSDDQRGFRVVDFATASRRGEPFEALITKRRFVPNGVMRYCTQELKIRPMSKFIRSLGHEHWTNVIGLRADEPRRVARQRAGQSNRERWDVAMPLADAGITKNNVLLFWKKQPFDLRLQDWEGNCDLCFLKSIKRRTRIMQDYPGMSGWWSAQEQRTGTEFRKDIPNYAALQKSADDGLNQLSLFDDEADGGIDCICNEGTAEEAA